jgi:hypothetical protein
MDDGARFLLDTSALLAHSREEQGWARVQALFEDADSEILAASLSLTGSPSPTL